MLMLPYTTLTRSCSTPSGECWPCAFKQLWFQDMPLLLLPDIEAEALAIRKKLSCTIRSSVSQQPLILTISELYTRVGIHMRWLNRNLLRSMLCAGLAVSAKTRIACKVSSRRQAKGPPANLSSLPAELRLKIFDLVTEGTSMNVVGYRHGKRDAFYFKERGNCSIALTCKQFHEEALEAYFKNLTVRIKSASPSTFGGDMSAFGAPEFRDRLQKLSISDQDEARRLKISLAFHNACIEHENMCAAGARKGAYYFS